MESILEKFIWTTINLRLDDRRTHDLNPNQVIYTLRKTNWAEKVEKAVETLNLDGPWTLRNANKQLSIEVEVPGTVFEVLLQHKIIDDPFYGLNEHTVAWVFESEWTYSIELDVSQDFFTQKHQTLRFHGLDTLTKIYLNHVELGSTNNMFRTYNFNVKGILKLGKNHLQVEIFSPTVKAREYIAHKGINLNTGYAGLPGIPYLRKAQYSFGWDWGPQLPDLGIWKSVQLIGWDIVKIDTVYVTSTLNYNFPPESIINLAHISDLQVPTALVNLEIDLERDSNDFSPQNMRLYATLISPEGEKFSTESDLESENVTHNLHFIIDTPQLWWTHDLGVANLYDLTVDIKDTQTGEVIDTITQKIGIREIILVRNSDKWGESFYFRLNGVPIFAKGANWIPVDSFIPRGHKKGLYEINLQAAIDANMNFIRVWGGGIYETTHFYDLCDQMGLLVWQDFPFACAIYPFDGEFIANVKEEAIQNIKRLRNHPSLAIWVGNNEVEWLWSGLALNTKLIGKRIHNEFKKGYRTLFEEIFPEIIRKFDPATDYWPSSPSNGGGRIKPYHAAVSNLIRSNSPDKGDSHFWNVWHQSAPFTAYRKFFSRFMSEYGFESLPGMKTIKTFCSPDQMEFTSIIMENHQKNAAGNAKIMKYMKKRFIIPKEFEKQVLLSQITHGEALEYGIEHWRRHRANFHCMGSLYWQLNDCWPVASWASIDYCGRWKAAHYFVKRCYKPLYASVKETRRYMELWITNDLRSTQKGTISWTVLNSEGTIIFIEQHKFLIAPCSSKQIRSAKLSKVLKKPYHLKDKVIFFSLKKDSGDRTQHADQFGFRLFHSFKTFPLKEPNLTFEVITTSVIQKKTMDYYAIELAIKAQNVAFYNYLDLDDMDFVASDNFFGLMPNQKRKISIHVPKMQDKTELSLKTILKHLHVKSLYFLLNS